MWQGVALSILLFAAVQSQLPPQPTPDLIEPPDPRCLNPRLRIKAGFGYLSDPTRCDAWIRCSYLDDGSTVQSERQLCGCGMFWNDDLMTCIPAMEMTCPNDRCAPNNVNSYGFEGNCRTYWSCDGSRTARGMCCNRGQSYDSSSQSCVTNAACNDECLCFEASTTTFPCGLEHNPADPHSYYETVHGVRYLRTCANGVNFNVTNCGCDFFVEFPVDACPTDFHIQCNTNPLTDIANRVWIQNQNVVIDTGTSSCQFDGVNSELCLPRYANMDWRYEWAVKLVFDPQGSSNSDSILFSNNLCADGSTPSISLILGTFNGNPVIRAQIATADDLLITPALDINYRINERNSVYMWYTGEQFNVCVMYSDGTSTSDSRAVSGLTNREHCSVLIGSDAADGGPRYAGVIHEVKTHVFCVPSNFCGS